MKTATSLLFSLLVSGQAFAGSVYLCGEKGTNIGNLIFVLEKNQVVAFKTPITDWSESIQGTDLNQSETEYSFQYDDSNDTNLGYDIVVNTKEEVVSAVEWISGNDSDNHDGSITNTVVECIKQ